MGDLSEHFSEWEFACKGEDCCGGVAPAQSRLIDALEELRYWINHDVESGERPIDVSSGFRCRIHNKNEKGEADSRHMRGEAADISVEGVDVETLAGLANDVQGFREGGIGRCATFLHVDVRKGGSARWTKE